VYDEALSRAVVIYFEGVKGQPWPDPGPAFAAVFGDQAFDLLAKVQAAVDEVRLYMPDPSVPYSEAMNRIEIGLRQHHPGLNDKAVRYLVNYFHYLWK
jgi:hypothetical protein